MAPGFAWKQTAQDGVQLKWSNDAADSNRNPKVRMSPANRADVLGQAPSTPGEYALKVDVFPNLPGVPVPALLRIRVEGEAMQPAMGFPARQEDFPVFPESLSDIDPAGIRLRRQVTFDTVSFRGNGERGDLSGRAGYPGIRASRHTIDGEQFQNNVIAQSMLLDTAEEWTLVNTTRIPQTPPPLLPPLPPGATPRDTPFLPHAHPFHIHINPFQVVEIFDPLTMDEPKVLDKDFVWHDTIGIPPAYNYYPNGKPRLDKDGKQTFVNGYVEDAVAVRRFPRTVRIALPHPGARGSGDDAAGAGRAEQDDGRTLPLGGGSRSRCLGPPHANGHFDSRSEFHKGSHQAIDRESSQVCVADAREVGRRNTGLRVRRANRDAPTVERLDDLGCEGRLELQQVGVVNSQVAEQLPFREPRPSYHSASRISLSLFNRSPISLRSARGVLIPCFDFF